MRPFFAAIALAAALPGVALAQAPAATDAAADTVAKMASGSVARSLEGFPVKGEKGQVLGHVERVVPGPDGRPAQVLVRPRGLSAAGPRSLAFGAVSVTENAIETPLSRAEFEAMPAVEQVGK